MWDVPSSEDHGPILEALGHGRCPADGWRTTWTDRIAVNLLVAPWWEDVRGGYWCWTGLTRDEPCGDDNGNAVG